MNKKGFTLVELLATLVILSIIMLIAVPNVISIIDKQKNQTYINDAKRFISLFKYQYRIDKNNTTTYTLGALETGEIDESPNGTYNKESSKVCIDNSGNISVNLFDGTKAVCATETELNETKKEKLYQTIKTVCDMCNQ